MPCGERSCPAGCHWAPASETQSGDSRGKVGQGCLGPQELQNDPRTPSTACFPRRGQQPGGLARALGWAAGARMGVQALPLAGRVACGAEALPGSASPSRLSNDSPRLTSRLKVGLGLSLLEIRMWGYQTGWKRLELRFKSNWVRPEVRPFHCVSGFLCLDRARGPALLRGPVSS